MSSKLDDDKIVSMTLSPEARALLKRRSKLAVQVAPPIPTREAGAPSPLSPAQEMVWLSNQLDRTTSAYNRCSAMRIIGHLDRTALQRSLSEIVRRHAILRSHVELASDQPTMRTSSIDVIALPVTDLSMLSPDIRPTRLRELLDAEAREPFDVGEGPWIRAGLISEDDETNTLFISTHHIASDGWSDAVMFRELHALYGAFAAGEPSPLGPMRIQYSDFAAWQRGRVESPELPANAEYWRHRMIGAPTTQQLPFDRPRVKLPDMSAGQVERGVEQRTVYALEAIGREQGATTAMTMLAAFQLLQFRITGQSDSVVGLSLAGRLVPEVGELIGLFNTVLPLRVAIDRGMTFRSLLDSVRSAVLEAQAHGEVPVRSVVEFFPPARGARQADIAQTLFNFRNMPAFEPSLPGLEVQELDIFNGGSVADLQLEVIEMTDGIECGLRFRTDVFDESTAERLIGHYVTLLESIAAAPNEQVGRLQILTERERHQILTDFKGPVRSFPPALSIDQLFSEQALRTPDATAVSYADGALTYRQLALASDTLGRELQSRGIAAGDLVGVCMDRSPQMIVSLFAILKCGAAFVPLDTDYPPERLAHMLSDTHPSLLLADAVGESLLGSRGVEIFIVGTKWLQDSRSDESSFFVDRAEDTTACVLYTSGSTGLPKGVLSTHRGIVNNLRAMQDMFQLTPDDCMLQQTSPGFDAAAWEIFWPLSVGARTYLARPGGQRDAEYVVDLVATEQIATVGFAPSMLKVMLRMPAFTGNPRIKRVMSYGEVLSPSLVRDLFARMPAVEIHNLYGPTETSIAVTTWNCERHTHRRTIPVGLPVANTEIYILDPALEPVPVGVEGEVYIGGICVSNGYFDRTDLTSERFITHPFRPDTEDRVYRTGDIARFGSDGVIEYRGRRDHQLKIRGLRVELEEIEAALCHLPGVRESVVIANTDSDDEPRLIAYLAVDESEGTPVELRRALESRLPPQFVPAQIICLDDLPHSLNGKINRELLPDPVLIEQPRTSGMEPPSTPQGERLVEIWKDLLGISAVGARDSFFDLGGHSLLAVRMLQRVADELHATVRLRVFYQDPTIDAVERLIAGDEQVNKDEAPIFSVRQGTSGSTPLFYLNGQPSGGGKYARDFATFLPADQGLYIVPVPIFENPVTVESVAAKMTQLIRSEQPVGPYLIGGNCFGATLALEIAQQLVTQREIVSLVVLVHPDARAPMHIGFRAMRRLALLSGLGEDINFAEFSGAFDYTWRTLRAILDNLRSGSPKERDERLVFIGGWLKEFATKNARRPLAMWSALRSRGPREADESIQEGSRWQNEVRPALSVSGDKTAESEIVAHAQFMSDAWTGYTPLRYDGHVAIIWPVAGPANPPWDPRALWNRLTPKLEWHLVPGNHWSMLHQHFDHSARALRASIERARTSG